MRPFVVLAAAVATSVAGAQQRRVITFEDFAGMRGVSDAQISPDGKSVLYAVRTTDIAGNARSTATFVAPVSAGEPHPFPCCDGPNVAATEARWSPDGKHIAYIADDQLWIADANGLGRHKVTSLNGGATGPVWSPVGDRIAFTSAVYPECSTDACNVGKAKTATASKLKAHVADQLMFRHWNAWDDGTRSHLFVVTSDGRVVRDLMPGAKYDVPPGPFGGSEGYAWSPDGHELTYTAKNQGRADAWTTDVNLYTVSADGGAARRDHARQQGRGPESRVFA